MGHVDVFFLQRWYANWVPRWRPDSDTFVYIGWAVGAIIIVLDLAYPGGLGMLLLRILGKELPVAGYGSVNSLHPGFRSLTRASQRCTAVPARPQTLQHLQSGRKTSSDTLQLRRRALAQVCLSHQPCTPPEMHTTRLDWL